ncbi:MAG: hypothetical protein ACREV5_09930 [Steroidobacter sp.]
MPGSDHERRTTLIEHGKGAHMNPTHHIPNLGTRRFLQCVLASIMTLIGAAAWSLPVFCESAVASTPILDPLSTSAAVGNFTMACNGGAQGDPSLSVDIQSFLNVDILQNITPTLTDGVNVYSGVLTGVNGILFTGVLLDPFASFFTFRDILVDASLLLENALVVQFVTLTGAPDVFLNNPQQVVAANGALPVNVPEPAPAALLGLAFAALLLVRRLDVLAYLRNSHTRLASFRRSSRLLRE